MPAACAAVPGFPPVCNSYLDSIIYFENYNPSVHTDPFFTGICFLQESVFYRNLFFTGICFLQESVFYRASLSAEDYPGS